jgi:hypothetical protein
MLLLPQSRPQRAALPRQSQRRAQAGPDTSARVGGDGSEARTPAKRIVAVTEDGEILILAERPSERITTH